MKFLTILLLLLVPFVIFGQEYYEYSADHFFNNNTATLDGTAGAVDDSTLFNTTKGYWELKTTATADTVVSDKIIIVRAGNDITVYAGIDSVSGTTNVAVQFGYYRGPELGWSWNTMATFAAEGASITYKIPAQTFSDEVLQQMGLRVLETGAQKGDYWFRVKVFRWR